MSCSGRLITCWGTWHVLFASYFRERLSFLVCPLSMVLNSIQLEIVRVMHFGNQNSLPEMKVFFLFYNESFFQIHILYISVSSLSLSSSQLIPSSLRSLFLQSGWERALTTSSFITQRLNPLLFGQKKRGAALFFSVPPYSRCS